MLGCNFIVLLYVGRHSGLWTGEAQGKFGDWRCCL